MAPGCQRTATRPTFGTASFELLQTLADELRSEVGQPGEIAARARKAGDEAVRNRIRGRAEDNGQGPRRVLGGQGDGCASTGHDDINLERDQFGPKSGEPLQLPLGISVFDHDVAAVDVTEATQSLKKGLLLVRVSGQPVRQIAYSRDLRRLLGLYRERHG